MRKRTAISTAILTGIGVSSITLLSGCTAPANHQDRVQLIRDEWSQVNEAIDEWYRQAKADCNGDPTCLSKRGDEVNEMRRILLE